MSEHSVENDLKKSDESESDWNEASFAKLLGFHDGNQTQNQPEFSEEEEIKPEEIQNQTDAPNPIATQELFDDPQVGKTQQNFYSNPFAKFGAVGLVMLVVFGSAATVLNSIMSGSLKTAPTAQYSKQSKPKVEIADNQEENETGKLKAELALSTQAEKIKSVERAKSPKTTVSKPKVKPNKEPNLPPVTRTTPTREPNLPVRTQIVSRQLPLSQVPYIPRLQPQTVRYNSPPSTPAVRQFQPVANKVSKPISTPTEEKADPMEEWSRISRLGSYGSSTITTNIDEQHKGSTIDTVTVEQQKPVIPSATLVSAVQTTQTLNTDELEPLHSEEASIIGYQNNYQLTVGTFVDGKLLTPLIWSEHFTSNNPNLKSKNNSKSEKFVIELQQPLTMGEGLVVLPPGSQVVAQINNVASGGFVELQATQVLINGEEYILPPNSITIRGTNGKPLIASRLNSNKGEIARRDAQIFAVGSLAKVGKVINQPKEEQISTSSGFGGTNSFSSVRRSRENILGAVLEGGFEPLTQQILRRNQQALQKLQQQEDVWYVKAGTNVQVFVNQSFQF
ncbi:conjugal transfer protein TrbI [Plectonema cf. radiosum LEGE 06105]|uniref:Conjugal transfer protein TrbI n=1 Tax=Plectonema cf. radiosum LEGE 06105 TaxID=945769 RepID=A0A8J7K476_9CYAN|nr:TrbI/VirB10 family protein [Plectonema radiosum]MBE9216691.1 conjugal transfer protein TrbI [Plectonema cf. radiosum LEGE 06105]